MRWPLILILGFTLLSLYAANTILGTLIPSISSQFSLTPIEKGAILGGYGFTYAAMQIPVGFLSDRYEPRKIITLSMFGLFVAALLFSFVANMLQLLAARLAMGIAASFLYVDGLKTIEVYYGRNERGRAIGAFSGLGYAGITTSNLFAQFFLHSTSLGWRFIYQASILLVLSSVVLCFLYLPSRLLYAKGPTLRKRELTSAKVEQESSRGSGLSYRKEFLFVIENKFFWIHTMIAFVVFGSLFAVIFWLPTYFDREGFGILFGSVATSLVGVGSAVGSIIIGLLADKLRNRLPILRVTIALYVVLLSLISYVLVSPGLGLFLMAACFGIGFSQGAMMPNTRIVAELYPKEVVGTAFGIFNTFGWLGSATFPFLVGVFLNFGLGFSTAFLAMICSLIIILVSTIFSIETGNLGEKVLDRNS